MKNFELTTEERGKMKNFEINYICPISKTSNSMTVYADNKSIARKMFNGMWYKSYKIISIILIKE